jgi:hypothetical protein
MATVETNALSHHLQIRREDLQGAGIVLANEPAVALHIGVRKATNVRSIRSSTGDYPVGSSRLSTGVGKKEA